MVDLTLLRLAIDIIYIRDSQDDGLLTGLLLGPLIASGLLITALRQQGHISANPDYKLLPAAWRIEAPIILNDHVLPISVIEALVLSRRNLVNIATVCSTILLAQVVASWWYESRYVLARNAPEGERASVPRREGRKLALYVLFMLGSTFAALCVRALAVDAGAGIWQSE